jgi:hypothetical protein
MSPILSVTVTVARYTLGAMMSLAMAVPGLMKWMWDRMVDLGSSMLRDYMESSGTQQTIGGMRAFKTSFGALPVDPAIAINVAKARNDATTKQMLALQFLGVKRFKDTADMMALATVAAAKFMKSTPNGMELAQAEAFALTSIFTPDYLLALKNIDTQELIDMQKKYEANKEKMKLSEKAIRGWIHFRRQVDITWASIEKIIAQKLAEKGFIDSLNRLSQSFVTVFQKLSELNLTDSAINFIVQKLDDITDWIESGKYRETFREMKKFVFQVMRALKIATQSLETLGNIFKGSLIGTAHAEQAPEFFRKAGLTFRPGIGPGVGSAGSAGYGADSGPGGSPGGIGPSPRYPSMQPRGVPGAPPSASSGAHRTPPLGPKAPGQARGPRPIAPSSPPSTAPKTTSPSSPPPPLPFKSNVARGAPTKEQPLGPIQQRGGIRRATGPEHPRVHGLQPNANRDNYLAGIAYLESDYNTRSRNSIGATGAFQFIDSTARGAERQGLPNPQRGTYQEQSAATWAWIQRNKPEAARAIERGDFATADRILNRTWTSLPGGAEMQNARRYEERNKILQGGGTRPPGEGPTVNKATSTTPAPGSGYGGGSPTQEPSWYERALKPTPPPTASSPSTAPPRQVQPSYANPPGYYGGGQQAAQSPPTASSPSTATPRVIQPSNLPPAVPGTQSTKGTVPEIDQTLGVSREVAPSGAEPVAVIIHHTGHRQTAKQTVDGWRSETSPDRKNLGSQYIIDRQGVAHDVQKEFNYDQMQHVSTKNLTPEFAKKGVMNPNIIGVEIEANDDKDVTPAQVETAKRLARAYPNADVLTHGEVNPGHKEKDEGKTAAAAINAERKERGIVPRPDTSNILTPDQLIQQRQQQQKGTPKPSQKAVDTPSGSSSYGGGSWYGDALRGGTQTPPSSSPAPPATQPPPPTASSPSSKAPPTAPFPPDQGNRPSRYQGTISFNGKDYSFSNGGPHGRGSAPYGDFKFTPEVAGGEVWHKYNAINIEGGKIWDPKFKDYRTDIYLHRNVTNNEYENSLGCFVVPGRQQAELHDAMLDEIKKNGPLYIHNYPGVDPMHSKVYIDHNPTTQSTPIPSTAAKTSEGQPVVPPGTAGSSPASPPSQDAGGWYSDALKGKTSSASPDGKRPPMYGFPGINVGGKPAFDEASFNKYATAKGYEPVFINDNNPKSAAAKAKADWQQRGGGPAGVYGFSKGAETANLFASDPEVAKNLGTATTIGAYRDSNLGNLKGMPGWNNYPDYSSRGGRSGNETPQGEGVAIPNLNGRPNMASHMNDMNFVAGTVDPTNSQKASGPASSPLQPTPGHIPVTPANDTTPPRDRHYGGANAPGQSYTTAEQAGISPAFPVAPNVNWQMLNAEYLARLNQAYRSMPPADQAKVKMISGYRPPYEKDADQLGMDRRSSQEYIYKVKTGEYPPDFNEWSNGRPAKAARPGGSDHQSGAAADFEPSTGGYDAMIDATANLAGGAGARPIGGDPGHLRMIQDDRNFLQNEPKAPGQPERTEGKPEPNKPGETPAKKDKEETWYDKAKRGDYDHKDKQDDADGHTPKGDDPKKNTVEVTNHGSPAGKSKEEHYDDGLFDKGVKVNNHSDHDVHAEKETADVNY